LTSALRDLVYAGAAFVWSIAAFTILVTGVSVTASLLVFVVGVFVWVGFVYVVRWTTGVDRRLAGWQRHERLDAAYRRPPASGFLPLLRTVSSDPQTWRDVAWLGVTSVAGLTLGLAAVIAVGIGVAYVSMPIWYWAIPDPHGQYGLTNLGLFTVDTPGEALAMTAVGLALVPAALLLARGYAIAHAALAARILSPAPRHVPRRDDVVPTSDRIEDAMAITGEAVQSSKITTKPVLIELSAVHKVYRTGKLEYPALRGVDLAIEDGDMVAIVGPSGSGKSTIMNMITGIDRATSGTVTVDGQRIDQMSEEELAVWRGWRVGVVFQFFQLLPTLTALENAMLPMDFSRRVTKRERAPLALHNLEQVGLADKADHLPSELSGGEQQRVAIARALVADPPLLIGDEPTGNLDTRTAAEMLDLLRRLNDDGTTVLYVTHDLELAARAHRVVTIRDGVVASD
jgi:putative ABC transport system ATP-binding protein